MSEDIIDQIIESEVSEQDEIQKNEFLEDFLVEAKEYIETVEMSLLDLENDIANRELLNNIFRSIHSLKGLSGFVAQHLIEKIAHRTENLLSKIRKNELIINSDIINKILLSVDYINKICDNLSLNTDEEYIERIEKHLSSIDEIVESDHYINYLKLGEILENEYKLNKEEIEKILHLQNTRYKNLRFGEVGIIEGIINPADVAEAIKKQLEIFLKKTRLEDASIPKLGEILQEREVIDEKDLQLLIKKQNEEYKGEKLGEIALKEKKAKAEDIKEALELQSRYSKVNNVNKGNFYVRLPITHVDDIVNMVGELMILQSQIVQELNKDGKNNAKLVRSEKIIKDLQQTTTHLRMVTLKSIFQKLKRIGRDTIQQLGKNADIFVYGAETEIDRDVIDKLITPLTHLVKNAISHGLETDEERAKTDKDPTGKIIIKAFSKRGNVYIKISDDGKGLDLDTIKNIALKKNLVERNTKYSEEEIINFIFLPGFSTKQDVDKISGRGVGMDVVREEIRKVSGKVSIETKKGEGSTFILKIPINMAALNGTVVAIQDKKYILPTNYIKEIIRYDEKILVNVKGKEKYFKIRGKIVPILSNEDIFSLKSEAKIIIVLELEGKHRAIQVDEVVERREIVVKSIGEEVGNINYISGASILGDGKVALILDIESLFK